VESPPTGISRGPLRLLRGRIRSGRSVKAQQQQSKTRSCRDRVVAAAPSRITTAGPNTGKRQQNQFPPSCPAPIAVALLAIKKVNGFRRGLRPHDPSSTTRCQISLRCLHPPGPHGPPKILNSRPPTASRGTPRPGPDRPLESLPSITTLALQQPRLQVSESHRTRRRRQITDTPSVSQSGLSFPHLQQTISTHRNGLTHPPDKVLQGRELLFILFDMQFAGRLLPRQSRENKGGDRET